MYFIRSAVLLRIHINIPVTSASFFVENLLGNPYCEFCLLKQIMHRLDNLLEQMGQNFPQNAVVFCGKPLTNCGRRSQSGMWEFVSLCVDEVVKHEYLERI